MNNRILIFTIIVIIIIIILLAVFMLKNNTVIKIPQVFKYRIDLNEKPIEIDNKIIERTPIEIKKNKINLIKYKHNRFIKNINNSLNYCLDNKKFLLADKINEYKSIYMELYEINKKMDKKNTNENNKSENIDYEEQFLLKSIQLDNLNNVISKMN